MRINRLSRDNLKTVPVYGFEKNIYTCYTIGVNDEETY